MSVNRSQKTIFYIATMLYWFSMYTYIPILSPYVEHLGGSLFLTGLIIGSYGLTQMVVRIPLGIWSDRLGKRKLFILAGIAIAAGSSLGFAMSSNVWLVLVFRALAGVAAASWVPFTVLFASYFSPAEAPKAMGLISFYTSLGQMAATTLGGFLAEYFGWHSPFLVGAVGGCLGLLLALRVVETPPDPNRKPLAVGELLHVGRDRLLLSVSLLAVIGQSVVFTTMFGFTPLHAVSIGASKSDLGILTLLTTLPNAIAGYVSGSLVIEKIGERRTLIVGFLITAVCTILLPFTKTFGMLLVTQICNGFGQGLLFPILMGLAIRSVSGNHRATAMGFFQAIYSLGMFGGPFLAGWIGKLAGLQGGFVVIGCLSAVGMILSKLWIPAAQAIAPECQET